MPSSAWEHHDFARQKFDELAPRRIVDVGPGSGKWAQVLGDRPVVRHDGQHWTGLEIFPRYVLDYELTTLYDRIVIDDVRKSLDVLKGADLVILGDVLEHMARDEAEELCTELRDSYVAMLVAGPIIDFPQGEWQGNVHETHVWQPTPEDWIELVQPDEYRLGEIVGTFWRGAR
jgi:hypothetical protein